MTRVPNPTALAYPIERHIILISGQKVMLNADLAQLNGVRTKRLNEAVKRDLPSFPGTFMFQLTRDEVAPVRSQFATASRRNVRYQPLAFTEHGVVMLSSVLNSPCAIQMSILVVEAFVRLRAPDFREQGACRPGREAGNYQRQISSIIEVLVDEIEHMKQPPVAPKRTIGLNL
jgi:hypothetical protein